jgi:uncharacterized membrane protein
MMRNIRGVLDEIGISLEENQEIAAIVGAAAGVFLATAAERYGAEPNRETFAITVDQARASLLSSLALVFTALSIVLALTALTAGTMASKFSPRLLRMKLRNNGNKWVLGTFSLTASFIVTSQILLRSRAGDSLAPPATMTVSAILLIVTGILIIWYINGTLQALRVDHAVSWIGKRIGRAAKAHDHALRHDEVVAEIDLERPSDGIDLLAPDHGYVISVDTDRLNALMTGRQGCVMIQAGIGRPVVRGESIGWISTPSPLSQHDLDEVVDCVTVTKTRDPRSDVGYTISVLVDIGLMALSPAVNDPRTGVQCTEVLTEICAELSRHSLGVRTRRGGGGTPTVVVLGDTVGDFLDAAGRQILLYGGEDREVTAALLRLGRQGERFATSDRDRELARAFTADVESARANGSGSHGRAW